MKRTILLDNSNGVEIMMKKTKPEMHMLLLGMSHDHILVEIKATGLRHAVFFTSENLMEDAKDFAMKLGNEGIYVHEIVSVDPFESESSETMTTEIQTTIHKYSNEYKVVCGLTGGTNLMAISMALAALKIGIPCHYSIERHDSPVIFIDYLEKQHKEF